MINPLPISIKANDQTITYGNNIAQGPTQVIVDGLCEGDLLESITLIPSTTNVTSSGSITPSGAVIKNNGVDVTGNYEIAYRTGSLIIQQPPLSLID